MSGWDQRDAGVSSGWDTVDRRDSGGSGGGTRDAGRGRSRSRSPRNRRSRSRSWGRGGRADRGGTRRRFRSRSRSRSPERRVRRRTRSRSRSPVGGRRGPPPRRRSRSPSPRRGVRGGAAAAAPSARSRPYSTAVGSGGPHDVRGAGMDTDADRSLGVAACAVVDLVSAAFDRTWPRPNLPAHVKMGGADFGSGSTSSPSPELLACFTHQLDRRRLSQATLSGRKAAGESASAVDRRKLCETLASLEASPQQGRPRVAPSHRVVIVPTLGPQGGMLDPVFVLDFCQPFCAPSFGGGCGNLAVSASGAAVLYRLVYTSTSTVSRARERERLPPGVAAGAPAPNGGGARGDRGDGAGASLGWQIETVWMARDGAGLGTGIATNPDATADDLRASALWSSVVKMLREEPIGLPRSAAAKGDAKAMAWCCWVDLAQTTRAEAAAGAAEGGGGGGGDPLQQLEGQAWEEKGRSKGSSRPRS
jgi:hypothetical protein